MTAGIRYDETGAPLRVPVPTGAGVGPCEGAKLGTRLIPLPVYSTLPNEGSTFGFMPVILKVCEKSQRIQDIYAPSVSWNDVIRVTGSFRWFYYPSDVENLAITASASTNVNWGANLVWQNLPTEIDRMTDEFQLRASRSIFYRFFGLGPDTTENNETSYTRTRELVSYRKGLNMLEHFNVGIGIGALTDYVEPMGVPGLPLSPDVFPTAPGIQGSSLALGFLDFRYDSRPLLEYSLHGLYADLLTTINEGLWASPAFVQNELDVRDIFPEVGRFSGVARFYLNYVYSPDVPFYDQSSLGGSYYMRGYTEDRFIDQGAWTLELEERIRIVRSHIFGVISEWRVDPFVAVGQVFHDADTFFSHVRVSEGLGFRVWVRPNIVGRVDLGYGGEGLKVYVELGYPF